MNELRAALASDEEFKLDVDLGSVALVRHVPSAEDRYIMNVQELETWRAAIHQEEPAMRQCPYCGQSHQIEQIEKCPLKPRC